MQDALIRGYNPSAKKLIVFLVAGADWASGVDKISGGTISIVSICEESRRLKAVHDAEVIMCTLPSQHLLLRHTQFKNNTDVFRFDQLRKYFTEVEHLIVHIPEFLCTYFLENLDAENKEWMRSLGYLHFNVLNQNIRLMPEPPVLQQLKSFAALVTSTTAHQKYCNQEARDYYQVPIHKFSVWISPEKYAYQQYHEKENLIIVSPDLHESKEAVLQQLKSIEGLEIRIIQNLTYEEYKATISRAKWAITFGEGLDGYIIEPVFSGAVGFAVFNEQFFTPDFKSLPGIYSSYEEMLASIRRDIASLDNPSSFEHCQKLQFDLCAKYYSEDEYTANIKAFYLENYTFK